MVFDTTLVYDIDPDESSVNGAVFVFPISRCNMLPFACIFRHRQVHVVARAHQPELRVCSCFYVSKIPMIGEDDRFQALDYNATRWLSLIVSRC